MGCAGCGGARRGVAEWEEPRHPEPATAGTVPHFIPLCHPTAVRYPTKGPRPGSVGAMALRRAGVRAGECLEIWDRAAWERYDAELTAQAPDLTAALVHPA